MTVCCCSGYVSLASTYFTTFHISVLKWIVKKLNLVWKLTHSCIDCIMSTFRVTSDSVMLLQKLSGRFGSVVCFCLGYTMCHSTLVCQVEKLFNDRELLKLTQLLRRSSASLCLHHSDTCTQAYVHVQFWCDSSSVKPLILSAGPHPSYKRKFWHGPGCWISYGWFCSVLLGISTGSVTGPLWRWHGDMKK